MAEHEQSKSPFHKMSGEFSLMDIITKLNNQDEKINDIRMQLHQMSEIKESITKLTTESGFRRDDFRTIGRLDKEMQSQAAALRILGLLSVLLFPSLVACAGYLTHKVITLDVMVQVQAVKIKNLESKNAQSDSNAAEFQLSRHIWHAEGERFFEF